MSWQVVNDHSTVFIENHWQQEPSTENLWPSFGFIGIPFDHAVSFRPGTRFGPEKVIYHLNKASTFCLDKKTSIAQTNFFHFGESEVFHDLPKSYESIRKLVREIPAPYLPVCIGGDHSISDPIIRGISDRNQGKKIGVVVFDSHFDSRTPIAGQEHSGHWMKTIADVVDYSRTVQLGLDSNLYSEDYLKTAESKGILVKTPYEIRKQGWAKTLEETIKHISTEDMDGIYISVDIDCINQSFAPGTSVSNPAGFHSYEVYDAIFELASQVKVLGFDINEINPLVDIQDMTAKVGVQVVLNFIAGVVHFHNSDNQ